MNWRRVGIANLPAWPVWRPCSAARASWRRAATGGCSMHLDESKPHQRAIKRAQIPLSGIVGNDPRRLRERGSFRRSIGGRPPLRLEEGLAAARAELAALGVHARGDALDVRHELAAQAHGIVLAGRPLLGGSLGGGGRSRGHQRKAEQHDKAQDRPPVTAAGAVVHCRYLPRGWMLLLLLAPPRQQQWHEQG